MLQALFKKKKCKHENMGKNCFYIHKINLIYKITSFTRCPTLYVFQLFRFLLKYKSNNQVERQMHIKYTNNEFAFLAQ